MAEDPRFACRPAAGSGTISGWPARRAALTLFALGRRGLTAGLAVVVVNGIVMAGAR